MRTRFLSCRVMLLRVADQRVAGYIGGDLVRARHWLCTHGSAGVVMLTAGRANIEPEVREQMHRHSAPGTLCRKRNVDVQVGDRVADSLEGLAALHVDVLSRCIFRSARRTQAALRIKDVRRCRFCSPSSSREEPPASPGLKLPRGARESICYAQRTAPQGFAVGFGRRRCHRGRQRHLRQEATAARGRALLQVFTAWRRLAGCRR